MNDPGDSPLYNKDSKGRILYAVAYWFRGKFRIDYCHAKNQANARYVFFASLPRKVRKRFVRIIDIAPVIGYNVLDNHGDKLIV